MTTLDDEPAAVVQGFAPDVGWRDLAEGARAVRAGLLWVATNLDLTVPTPHGPAPGNGSLVAAVAAAGGRSPDEVAGKPGPRAFRDAAARAGSRRPLVVGDRLDTDLEGARAARIPGSSCSPASPACPSCSPPPPDVRPDLVGRDLGALLVAHPEAIADADGTGRCNDAVVAACDGKVVVHETGTDAVDLLRAACAAVWAAGTDDAPDPHPVIDAVRALDPTAAWAR